MFFSLVETPSDLGRGSRDWAALGLSVGIFRWGRQDWEDGTSVQPRAK